MQLRKRTAVVPGFCLSLLLLGTLLAQQLPPASSPKPAGEPEKTAPAANKPGSAFSASSSSAPGTSQGSSTVGPPPEAAKTGDVPASDAGKQGSIRVTVNEVIVQDRAHRATGSLRRLRRASHGVAASPHLPANEAWRQGRIPNESRQTAPRRSATSRVSAASPSSSASYWICRLPVASIGRTIRMPRSSWYRTC